MIVRRAAALLLLAAVLAGCTGEAQPAGPDDPSQTRTPSPVPTISPTPPPLSLQALGTYSNPVWVGPAPGDRTHLYLAEKTGRVLQLDQNGRLLRVVLDVRERIRSANEQGLLSIAFDPSYAQNRRMYAFVTDKDEHNRVLAYTVRNGLAVAPQELLAIPQPHPNHNGGSLLFDPTGMLLVGTGDGGSAGDPDNLAQNLGVLNGKLLRIDPQTGQGAKDNPFPRYPRIWAYGLRNPWRFSFDTGGNLYLGDVGQNQVEELNVLPPARQRGANYGWPVFEGDLVFKKDQKLTGTEPFIVPALTYPHVEGACSITAGEVYRGNRIGFLRGSYVFGDFCIGDLWATDRTATGMTPYRELGLTVDGLQAFGLDTEGELLVLSTKRLYRLVSP